MADTTSWAFKQVRTAPHMQCVIEMTLEEARKKLAAFEKAFPAAHKLWLENYGFLCHDDIVIRTDDREARCRPAKPVDVGSNPTPCSTSEEPPAWEKDGI